MKVTAIGLVSAMLWQASVCHAQPVTQISGSGLTTMFLKSGGSLWGMGRNTSGQLGDGTTNNISQPELIVSSNVTAVASGRFHTLFVKQDGSLWATGLGRFGELGDGVGDIAGFYYTNRPEQIVASNVVAVAVGYDYSLFLKQNGSLWTMGFNSFGQLGNGIVSNNSTAIRSTPQQIVSSNVTAITANMAQLGYSLFLKSDGSLWGMGDNRTGQLGDGTTNNANVPKLILASNVTAIAAGSGSGSQSLFLKDNGSLWGMGYNLNGELGNGTTSNVFLPQQIVASNVTAISAGGGYSLFLKTDGSLWAMGQNSSGQLGDGSNVSTNRPKQIVSGGVIGFAAGVSQSIFLKADGSLWGMGDNSFGELGAGSLVKTNRPIQILGAYNQIAAQLVSGGDMQLAFVGVAGSAYALDSATSLAATNWIPQTTNLANSYGALLFTNSPNATTNNFWRIRSVP